MGLDMYLYASKYVGNWDHDGISERKTYEEITKLVGLEGFRCPGSPSLRVKITVAYWRKANQIHKWFVDNVQKGQNDCRESYVKREQLEELRSLCKNAIENKNSAGLPPQAGFFFGGTEIDEWYWHDLEDTIKQLDIVLNLEQMKEDWEFYYRSSW